MGAGVPVVLRRTTRAARGEPMTLMTHLDNPRSARAKAKFPTDFPPAGPPGAPNPRVGVGCPPESAIIVGARGDPVLPRRLGDRGDGGGSTGPVVVPACPVAGRDRVRGAGRVVTGAITGMGSAGRRVFYRVAFVARSHFPERSLDGASDRSGAARKGRGRGQPPPPRGGPLDPGDPLHQRERLPDAIGDRRSPRSRTQWGAPWRLAAGGSSQRRVSPRRTNACMTLPPARRRAAAPADRRNRPSERARFRRLAIEGVWWTAVLPPRSRSGNRASQPQRVLRARKMPWRDSTSCWRYSGRCSENLLTRTYASSPGPSQPSLDRIGHRLGRGHAVLAAGTGILRVDVPQDHELAGHVVELLGHVLADLGLLAAAGADPLVGGDVVPDFLPGQVVGDLPAAVPLATTMCGRPPSRLWIVGSLGDRRRRIGIGGGELGVSSSLLGDSVSVHHYWGGTGCRGTRGGNSVSVHHYWGELGVIFILGGTRCQFIIIGNSVSVHHYCGNSVSVHHYCVGRGHCPSPRHRP